MNDALTTIAEEVTIIRKLMVFSLLNSGISQEKVAAALGISQATVSRLAGGGAIGSRRTTAKKKVQK
jgi:predicted transcriptional regulator